MLAVGRAGGDDGEVVARVVRAAPGYGDVTAGRRAGRSVEGGADRLDRDVLAGQHTTSLGDVANLEFTRPVRQLQRRRVTVANPGEVHVPGVVHRWLGDRDEVSAAARTIPGHVDPGADARRGGDIDRRGDDLEKNVDGNRFLVHDADALLPDLLVVTGGHRVLSDRQMKLALVGNKANDRLPAVDAANLPRHLGMREGACRSGSARRQRQVACQQREAFIVGQIEVGRLDGAVDEHSRRFERAEHGLFAGRARGHEHLAVEHPYPGHVVRGHLVDKIRTAYADRRDRRTQRDAASIELSGNESKHPARGVHRHLAGAAVGVVNEAVERHPAVGADVQP